MGVVLTESALTAQPLPTHFRGVIRFDFVQVMARGIQRRRTFDRHAGGRANVARIPALRGCTSGSPTTACRYTARGPSGGWRARCLRMATGSHRTRSTGLFSVARMPERPARKAGCTEWSEAMRLSMGCAHTRHRRSASTARWTGWNAWNAQRERGTATGARVGYLQGIASRRCSRFALSARMLSSRVNLSTMERAILGAS